MRMLLITLTVAALGCGKTGDKGDECQQIVEAAKVGLPHLAKESGQSEQELAAMLLDTCRKAGPVAKQCAALKDEVSVRKCYADALGIK